ncbi:MAG: methylglyoxal synthase [Bacteroidia bacterium]|nr:methylglyoxal synthase [Bacteroidia bacterium]
MSYRIALVAHDSRKRELADWAAYNWEKLAPLDIICTGTTGRMVEATLREHLTDQQEQALHITLLKSGPLGGDQQLGALIVEGQIDCFVFFWDPMSAQPHDVDVKALLRIAVLYNIPTACNRATADFLITSALFSAAYERKLPDTSAYVNRTLPPA